VQLEEAEDTYDMQNPKKQLILTEIGKPIHSKAGLEEI